MTQSAPFPAVLQSPIGAAGVTNTAPVPVSLAPGGAAMGGDLTGSFPNPLVKSATGATAIFPFTFSGVTRATIDNATGVGVFGGGGTHYYAALGPLTGFESADAGVWLLPNGVARSASNVAFYSDGSNYFLNGRFNASVISVSFVGSAGMVLFTTDATGGIVQVRSVAADPAADAVGPKVYSRGGDLRAIGTAGTITILAPP